MTRIFLEDSAASSPLTFAGHLYLVLRADGETDGVGVVIRGGGPAGPMDVQAGVDLSVSDDAYAGQPGAWEEDQVTDRHARDITGVVGAGSWSAMVAFAQGIDEVYDYELPFASGDRVHVANSNALIFSVLNLVGVDARTIDGIDPPNVDWYPYGYPGAGPSGFYTSLPTLLGSSNGPSPELIAAPTCR